MKIVYYSESGNVATFCESLEYENLELIEIVDGSEIIDDKFFLIIPTTGIGEVPDLVIDFLENEDNLENCLGAAVSGSIEWEDSHYGAKDVLEDEFNIKTYLTFEDEGTDSDYEKMKEILKNVV